MKYKCPFCGHEWTPRVDEPVSCPRCKRYFTKDKQPQKLDVEEIRPVRVPETLKCEFCDRKAKYFIAGRNVCEHHVQRALKKEETEIDYHSIVMTSTTLKEAIRRALIENAERLPENEVIRRVSEEWMRQKGMPTW
ncbi:MAG: hypothetical protein DRJ38_00300 [Thermoprotei archaeon]|nr:MAG: hypothetical protein DRJ38_00300 [Thermoprotei archaeon]